MPTPSSSVSGGSRTPGTPPSTRCRSPRATRWTPRRCPAPSSSTTATAPPATSRSRSGTSARSTPRPRAPTRPGPLSSATTTPRPSLMNGPIPLPTRTNTPARPATLRSPPTAPDLDNVNQGGHAFMPLRSADTLMGLADEAGPEEVHLLERGDVDAHGDTMTGCFWAPEIHEIDGRLSILFMPCYGDSPDYM